jgi:osmotically-inducible protein OsmY
MAEPQATTQRPDIDIADDIREIIVRYPPLAADRAHLHVAVQDGVVRLTGHTRTPINRHYLIDQAEHVAGVRALDVTGLHDDETIRLSAGKLLPPGVIVNVQAGSVVLSGRLPAGMQELHLAHLVAAVPGVRRVFVRFPH